MYVYMYMCVSLRICVLHRNQQKQQAVANCPCNGNFSNIIWDMLKPLSESFYSVYQATEVAIQEEVTEVVLQRFFWLPHPLRLHYVYCREVCVKIPYSEPHDGAFSSVSINHSPQFDLLNHNLLLNICPSFLVLTPDFLGYNSRNSPSSKICQNLQSTKQNLKMQLYDYLNEHSLRGTKLCGLLLATKWVKHF